MNASRRAGFIIEPTVLRLTLIPRRLLCRPVGILIGSVLSSATAAAECNWGRYLSGSIPIGILYLGLALYQINNQSLWTDEVISVDSFNEPLLNLLKSQHALYYVLLGAWMEIAGSTELALRAMSTILGLVAVCTMYALAFRLFGRRTAVFAGVLTATSPYLIWYAQEVRYILLMLATSLLSSYVFCRAIVGDRWTWWLTYVMTSIVSVLSFLTTILVIVAHALYVLCRASRRPILRKCIACHLAIFLFFGVWHGVRSGPNRKGVLTTPPTIVSNERTRSREVRPVADVIGALPYTFFVFSVGFSLGPSLRELHRSRGIRTLLNHAPTLLAVSLLFAAVFLFGLANLRHKRDARVFLLLWLILPPTATVLAATVTTYHVYNTRYVAMALPAYLLILAAGIAGFHRRRTQISILACILCVNAISLFNYYFDPRYAREDARSAARYLEVVAGLGDVILVLGNRTALNYYYRGDRPIVGLDLPVDSKTSVIAERLKEIGENYDRLWLVEIRPWEADPEGKAKSILNEATGSVPGKAFPGARIHKYQLNR